MDFLSRSNVWSAAHRCSSSGLRRCILGQSLIDAGHFFNLLNLLLSRELPKGDSLRKTQVPTRLSFMAFNRTAVVQQKAEACRLLRFCHSALYVTIKQRVDETADHSSYRFLGCDGAAMEDAQLGKDHDGLFVSIQRYHSNSMII